MKKIITIALVLLAFAGCANKNNDASVDNSENINETAQEESNNMVVIKESPDKYTWYILNYVGKNASTVGYESMGGERRDSYGDSNLKLVMITLDGSYVGVSDEELKEYVVVKQDIAPNTELKYTYDIDSDGDESYYPDQKSIEEIVLQVKKIGTNDAEMDLVSINPSPNKYTHYIRNYIGRNLAMCGYISMGGDLRDSYGDSNIELVIITDDGSLVDFNENSDVLKEYVVTNQNIVANTELKYTYDTYSDGDESYYPDDMNIETIDLYVKKVS